MMLIYAGDHKQAEWLAQALGLARNQWRSVEDRRSLDGYDRGQTILLWGTYRRRPNDLEMVDMMLAMGFKVLEVNDNLMRYRHS